VTARLQLNRAYAPQGWDYAKDDDPDVVFMKWNGSPTGGERAALGRAWDKSEKSWIPVEKAQ
jgi:hypothetical protein